MVRNDISKLTKERFPYLTINPEMVSKGIWLNGRGLWNEKNFHEINSGKSYTKNGDLLAIHNHEDVPITTFYDHLDSVGLISSEIDIKRLEFSLHDISF